MRINTLHHLLIWPTFLPDPRRWPNRDYHSSERHQVPEINTSLNDWYHYLWRGQGEIVPYWCGGWSHKSCSRLTKWFHMYTTQVLRFDLSTEACRGDELTVLDGGNMKISAYDMSADSSTKEIYFLIWGSRRWPDVIANYPSSVLKYIGRETFMSDWGPFQRLWISLTACWFRIYSWDYWD